MRKLLCALAERVLFVALLFIPGFALAPTLADETGSGFGYEYWVGTDSNGTDTVMWEDKTTGQVWQAKFDDKGNSVVRLYSAPGVPAVGGVDPNPEDNGKGTEPHNPAQEIAKAIHQAALNDKEGKLPTLPPSFWASPVGQYLIGQGAGLLPKYQPGDDDNNSIGAKPTKVPKLDDGKMIEDVTQKPGPLTTPGYQPNSGSFSDYVQGAIKAGPPPKGPGGDTGPAPKDHDTGNPHDKDKVKGHGLFSGDMPGPPELVNPNPVHVTHNALKCTSNATGGKSCTLTLASGRVLAFNMPSADVDKKAGQQGPQKNTKSRKLKTTTAQKSANCASNMAPNASGKGCVPKLDMGSDFTPGSMPGASRSGPAAVGGGAPAGRR